MKRYIKASRGDELIGIWWYTDSGDIWGVTKPTDDGVLDGMNIQYSDKDNHMTLWSSVLKDNVDDEEEISEYLKKGFRCLERGRVIYNTAAMVYQIICSKDIINNESFRSAVVDYFQLDSARYEFVPLDHYNKIELTGNPAVDAMIENNQI